MNANPTLNMAHVDVMVFIPQVLAIAVLCLVGVIDFMAPLSSMLGPILATIAVVSFSSGLVILPAKAKNVSPIKFSISVFLGTLLVGFGVSKV
jgi:hypothetical protein